MFKMFLFVYTGFIVAHAATLPWNSKMTAVCCLTGFAVALLAHMRCGILTIALLLVHMMLEWSEYARHCSHLQLREIVFHIAHVLLDMIFLVQVLQTTMEKFWKISFASIVAMLGLIFYLNYTPHRRSFGEEIHNHSHTHHNPIEFFVLGGMLGCVGYHFRKK